MAEVYTFITNANNKKNASQAKIQNSRRFQFLLPSENAIGFNDFLIHYREPNEAL